MTKTDAQKRCDQLRRKSELTGLTYEVEQERPTSAIGGLAGHKWVVRSYRNNRPTGSTYYI